MYVRVVWSWLNRGGDITNMKEEVGVNHKEGDVRHTDKGDWC